MPEGSYDDKGWSRPTDWEGNWGETGPDGDVGSPGTKSACVSQENARNSGDHLIKSTTSPFSGKMLKPGRSGIGKHIPPLKGSPPGDSTLAYCREIMTFQPASRTGGIHER